MPKKEKKIVRITSGLNFQNVLIFSIILLTFFGSAVLIWSFNTNALRTSVEAETNLSSSLLANDIDSNIPKELILTGAASGDLLLELKIIEENIENSSNVWIMDSQSQVYYRAGDESGILLSNPELQKALNASADNKDVSITWLGRKSLFFLRQQCCVIRPIYKGGLFLVMIDHADSAHALQRRQFTLMLALNALLLLVMMVLVVNTSIKYRSQLIRLATTDELTGLANRKNFNAEFAEFTAAEHLPSFSLFLLDIDFFKQINDNYGHTAGDNALRYLASQIQVMVNEQGGFAGRWGGDEFCLSSCRFQPRSAVCFPVC